MAINTPLMPIPESFMADYYIPAQPEERSVVEKLFDQLAAHEQEEGEILAEYQQAATEGPDAGYRYLMGLVLADEERHHRLSKAMADDVHQSLLWLTDHNGLPDIMATGKDREQLLRQTERFLQIEEDGQRQLDGLHEKVKALHSGLLELIVDIMRSDTKKHVHILKFIKSRLEAR
jgi:hypothetical protein